MKPTLKDWVGATSLALGYFALGLSIINLVFTEMVNFVPSGAEFSSIHFSAILAACALLMPNKYLRLTAVAVIAVCCWDGYTVYRYYVKLGLLHQFFPPQ